MPLPPESDLSPELQTMNWMSRPYSFLEEGMSKYGDSFTIDLKSHGKYVLFSHPDAVAEILSAPPDILVGSRGNRVLRPVLGKRSLLLIDGEPHRRQRRLILPAFHRNRISRFGEAISLIAHAEIDSWLPDQPFAMRDAMQRVSLEVILRVLLGAESSPQHGPLIEVFDDLLNNSRFNLALIGQMEDLGRIDETRWGREFKAARSRAYELVDQEIERRRRAPPAEETVVDMLLAAVDEEGNGLDAEELRDQVVTLIVTGHETTATALAWAVYWMLSTPDVHRRLADALASLGPDPSPEAINELPYLDALCRETLRIYPIIPIIARWVAEPFEIAGYLIDAGVTVSPAIYLVHHRPEIYENPDRFAPERFLERSYSANEYLPFGGSHRRCIGANLAMYEMKLVLAAIVRRTDLELTEPPPIQPVRRVVTMTPDGGTPVVMRRMRSCE
ncbi:MAG: cytochrome P450 [Bradymonadaceae bacterium]